MFFPTAEILFFNPLFSKEKRIYMFYYKTFSVRMLHLSFFIQTKFILLITVHTSSVTSNDDSA